MPTLCWPGAGDLQLQVRAGEPGERGHPGHLMSGQAGKLVVVGQGYVGLPVAMRAGEAGYKVVGFDTDASRVERLSAGQSYIEDVSSAQVARALQEGRYLPTTDEASLSGFDVAVITVPTPLREGRPDLSFVTAAASTLALHLRPGCLVVLESTTYPGTTEELVANLLAVRSGLVPGRDFYLGYSPERIDPGNQTYDLMTTPKIVSGIDAGSLAATQSFYDTIVDKTVPVSRPREAELAKLIENTFRHVNIALVNELAMFARDLGVDIWEALDAAATKPFGFVRFNPGPGVGGHCLPIDPSYLSWHIRTSLSRSFRFVELANDVNDHMPEYVEKRLMVGLNHRGCAVKGSRVMLLGMAYKPNTSDLRESPAIAIAQRLLDLGAALTYADNHVAEIDVARADSRLHRVQVTPDELSACDAILLVTDHEDVDYDMVAAHSRYVLDTRHRCRGPVVEYL
ncbi:MAG TPA: nucleotide sugar dehydrogenase [Acidimicrobiales bacterium]|nr:nucleotide sugar dehydrogenase [Acidimicrobiales bacterium]